MRVETKDWKHVVDISEDQWNHAIECTKGTSEYRRQAGFNAKAREKFIGFVAETVICDLFGINRPTPGNTGHDGGCDLKISGKSVDVKGFKISKTLAFRYGPVIAKTLLVAHQLNSSVLDTDVYIFCGVNYKDRQVEVVGWIKKWDVQRSWFIARGTPIPRGKKMEPIILETDNYHIPFNQLEKFNPFTFSYDLSMWA